MHPQTDPSSRKHIFLSFTGLDPPRQVLVLTSSHQMTPLRADAVSPLPASPWSPFYLPKSELPVSFYFQMPESVSLDPKTTFNYQNGFDCTWRVEKCLLIDIALHPGVQP